MTTSDAVPAPVPRKWSVDVARKVVTMLQIDFAFSLDIDQRIHIRIEEPFEVTEPDGSSRTYEPESWATLGPLLRLHQAVLSSAVLDEGGTLALRFEDGTRLVVPPHPKYENWSISGPGVHVFGLAQGSGISVYKDEGLRTVEA